MKRYYLWLSSLQGITNLSVNKLMDYYGSAKEIYSADDAEISKVLNNNTIIHDKSLDNVYKIMEDCEMHRIKILTKEDGDYPSSLKYIVDSPNILYVKGSLPLSNLSICIVGPRKASEYAKSKSESFAYELTKKGVTIVSGLAPGVDACAQIGALKAGGKPICVLANGLDICYPYVHRNIMDDIIAVGAVVSEHPPSVKPLPGNFPMRNRILSGLSDGIFIPEASKNSGALITAKHGFAQGKTVFAMPGNADNINNIGSNLIIQQGAYLTMNVNDILGKFNDIYGVDTGKIIPLDKRISLKYDRENNGDISYDKIIASEIAHETWRKEKPKEKNIAPIKSESTDLAALDAQEKTIYDAIISGYRNSSDISAHLNMNIAAVGSALTLMELNGFLKYDNGKYIGISEEK